MNAAATEGNVYDKAVSKFTAYVGVQPKLVAPVTVSGHVFASNNQACAIVPLSEVALEYGPLDESITVVSPIVERTKESGNRSDVYTVAQIRELLSGIPTQHSRVPEKPCEECEMRGAVECAHCGSWVECKACDGEGHFFKHTVKKDESGNEIVEWEFTKEYESGFCVKLGKAYLLPTYLRMLADAAEDVGVDYVVHVRAEEKEFTKKQVLTGDPEASENGEPEKIVCPFYQEFEVGKMRVGIFPIRTSGDGTPENREILELVTPA